MITFNDVQNWENAQLIISPFFMRPALGVDALIPVLFLNCVAIGIAAGSRMSEKSHPLRQSRVNTGTHLEES